MTQKFLSDNSEISERSGRIRETRRILTLGGMVWALSAMAFATPITVPNGDFSQSANDGTIGGGLIGGSGTKTIGLGPWSGTYQGILGLLVPPTLTITPGKATISGLAGAGVLPPLVDNSGYFSQTLPTTTYQPDSTYTLAASVDADKLLGLNVLSGSGVGIALMNGSNVLTSSTTAPLGLVSLTLLSGSDYELTLKYTTGIVAPTGNLGIRLFDMPNGLATADLLSAVSFDAVTLNANATSPTPEPDAFGLGGLGLLIGLAVGLHQRRTSC